MLRANDGKLQKTQFRIKEASPSQTHVLTDEAGTRILARRPLPHEHATVQPAPRDSEPHGTQTRHREPPERCTRTLRGTRVGPEGADPRYP